ncbi:CRISPR-associated endonuclease Cas2 [Lysinibacillus sp. fkY74-1]|uniref:CRISPR-associated endoribonuclease Cas2 n=1 Tax=Lysinibacillus fusiformis TaxID=28031 RepID=A0A1H9A879_9BACI|nr:MULTISPECIES: CRISPR-associated endonuclease Cas2 [Lysinibacillus]KEK09124.1 CRISPR-associated protein Cas2 [Lysinibacillus sphaericus]MCT6816838.1 CRISPR-associated endonuclease Cas2 [Lysinibacillus fusiformis]MCT6927712.1 CRISPR-associated endonuclease Cas2 [Lysinibacillus fusiformis]MCT6932346.1 CRISPR-associated endonuclease Cas2 [Lysinibacillus fusiformis]QIC49540.1 CRISPR-associated endonuclease Cas2 [Lysinibacillus sphaericus]
MLVLVTYDVVTKTAAGQKRLRKVAKTCENYGLRVQNSVFECVVDATQFKQLQLELQAIIDVDLDSLRFYQLGNNYKSKVKHIGAKETFNVEDTIIL